MVPITLITGALGVGKTSAMLELARARPPTERWVVLVNELGEVGIDGALLDDASGLEVAELPGGCLCCAARGPLLAQLRRVLRTLRPDRILVEPSGVADPGRVMDDLATLDALLEPRATITLVDPRAVAEPELRRGPWLAQVDAAEVLVGNKVDLCTADEVAGFLAWAAERFPPPAVVSTTVGGELEPAWLDLPGRWTPPHGRRHVHGALARIQPVWHDSTRLLPAELAGEVFRRAWSGPHHETCGWRIPADLRFERRSLEAFFHAVAARACPWLPGGALRAKGVVHTTDGWRSLQADLDGVRSRPSAWRADSRVELIGPGQADNDWAAVDEALWACRDGATA